MPRINLLPWREELRQKRKKEFFIAALGAIGLAAAVTMGVKVFYQAQISNQETRNDMLRSEIETLDRTIADINDLEDQKARLIDRMQIIDQLERTTPETVTLIDSLVNVLPDGTYLTSVEQHGTKVDIAGMVQSTQRVADLMRAIRNSEWLTNPHLGDVVTEGNGNQREGEFTMDLTQVRIADNEEVLK